MAARRPLVRQGGRARQLASGDNVDSSCLDVNLNAFAGLSGVADRLPYFTGAGALSLATLTAFGRGLVASASPAAGRQTLVLDHPTLRQYGAVNDGATNADAALAAAIAAGKQFNLPAGDYLVTGVTNPLGVEMHGDGRLLKSAAGGMQLLSSDADRYQHLFGGEYLYAFQSKLLDSAVSAKIVCSGDSTTEGGYAGVDAKYLIHALLKREGIQRGHSVDTVNAGHSGKNTAEWVSTYLSGDLAQAPDLYIVRWGINDPTSGRSIQDFATSLRQGLQTVRASKGVDELSVLLMTPNTTADTYNGRDEKWQEAVRKVCRQAAREFQCAFIDTYALWRDGRSGADLWMDNPMSLGQPIHPKSIMNVWICSVIADAIFPSGLKQRMTSDTVLAAALPSAFPFGCSTHAGTAAGGFPIDNASVVTFKAPAGQMLQVVFSSFTGAGLNGGYAFPQIAVRTGLHIPGTLDDWHWWNTQPSISLTLQNSWVAYSANTAPRASKVGQVVTLSGAIRSGTVTNGTVVCTLPTNFRPRNAEEFFSVRTNTTTATTPCVLKIESNGNVSIVAGASNALVAFSGISFEAGA